MSTIQTRASIDLGTNTCLLLIAEWDADRRRVVRVIEDHSTIVRLGQGVDRERKLHDDAMQRTLQCLSRYSERVKARGLHPAEVVAVATSQARDAKNGSEFFSRVERETGFRFRVISGEQEASASFEGGLLPGMDPARCAIIDIGGGSTELMSNGNGLSIDMGSVRYTDRFLRSDPVTDDEFWACQDAVDTALEAAKEWRASLAGETTLVAVAGTATTLAAWHLGLPAFDASKIDGLELTRGDLHRMVEELKWRTVAERRQLPGVESQRADVLLAGAMILWRSMELLGFSKGVVSTRGLRFGVMGL